MFTLRCTSRLMKRLGASLAASPAETTTRLGDWYANSVHVGRRQFVLCVSEQTLQPVVLPAAPIATLVPRLRVGVAQVLAAVGIADEDIAKCSPLYKTHVSPDRATVAMFGAALLERVRAF